LSNRKTALLGFYTSRFDKLFTDCSVQNMNPDVTPNGISLDVIVAPNVFF